MRRWIRLSTHLLITPCWTVAGCASNQAEPLTDSGISPISEGKSAERDASSSFVDADGSVNDAGMSVDDHTASEGGQSTGGWLSVVGTKILAPDGKPFHGRGANFHDTRSCNACTSYPADVAGLMRWSDELLDNWHANFLRFDLSAYAGTDGYRQQWQSLNVDAGYLADIKTAVTHMTDKPGVYIMVTLFLDPAIPDESFAVYDSEWPTAAATPLYETLAETFADNPKVLFGLTNEPHGPPENDAELAARYDTAIAAIRAVETEHGEHKHVVVVQAPRGYARDVTYFVDHPLAGENIAYEIHPYNPQADFDRLIVQPSKKLPLIIGEYGPASVGGSVAMTAPDIEALWLVAEANDVSHIAWNFHMRCSGSADMLVDSAPDGCGLSASTGYAFPRTAWGDMFRDHLAQPW